MSKKANSVIIGFFMVLIANFTAMGQKSQTAQSIMVQFEGAATYTVVENQLWRYDETVASGYFNNELTGGPAVSCNGNATNCGTANQPATPVAPAPNPVFVNGNGQGTNGTVGDNKCTFLSGGALSGDDYTQSITINGLNGRGNWTFTWSYAVTANVESVDPFTAWVLQDSNSPNVPVNAFIAGESVVVSKQHPAPGKFSFSIRDDLGLNRVTDLTVTVDGVPYSVGSTVVENVPGTLPGEPGAVDFLYARNAGSNGSLSLLAFGENKQAREILNSDSFNGNQNGGADGKALAKAVMDTLSLPLATGDHTVTLTGVVKGNNAATTPTTFSVTRIIHVITPGCGQGN